MSEIVLEEWDAMDPATISHCWVKARILPTPMEATVLTMHGSYRHSLRAVAENVEKVLFDKGICSICARCFGDAGPAERQLAVETWFGMESDTEAIIDTADADFLEESSDGETQDEDEYEIKVVGLMHMAAPNRKMRSGCANRAYLEFHGHPWNQLREGVVAVHCKRPHKSLPILETAGSAFLLVTEARRAMHEKGGRAIETPREDKQIGSGEVSFRILVCRRRL